MARVGEKLLKSRWAVQERTAALKLNNARGLGLWRGFSARLIPADFRRAFEWI